MKRTNLADPAAVARRRVGRNIQALRTVRGWSQQTLADRMGWHRETVSEVERGRRGLAFVEAVKLAKVFRVTLADLAA